MDTTTRVNPNGDDTEGDPPPPDESTRPLTGEGGGGTMAPTTRAWTPLHLGAGVEPIPGYTLVRRLGRGGFGEVWEALAPGGVHVALKFIRLDTKEASLEERALEIIRNIRHPHLLDVQFAVRVADCLVIAMPLCERSLLDRLRECQAQGLAGLPRDELLGYMDDLAQALDFLNEPRHALGEGGKLVGIQHRDVKPHNAFLVGGSARLADFGLAKVLEASGASHSGCMSHHYVAPEMINGHVSRWSDQYSLAVMYYELRTGRRPFEGNSILQVIYAHQNQPPDLSALPDEERALVTRALAKQPDERWTSCREFVRHLKETASSEIDPSRLAPPTKLPEASDSEISGTTSAEAHSHRWLRRAGLAVLPMMACLAALIYVIQNRGAAPVHRDIPARRLQQLPKVEVATEV
ncbi:MAG: serine/threonine protein kinase, partial [Singulisphaera sp.]|nr:serine/threonine protein kinase [Singulisphaera sp.]